MTRMFALATAGFLTALPAQAFDINAMTADERAAFGAAVRSYLLENPEILRDMSSVLTERESTAALAEVEDTTHAWVGGNPDGDVTIVEFADYKCGYCKQAHEELMQLVEADGNIRLILREYPILGQESQLASLFAVAVLKTQGADAYKTVHDKLMGFRGKVTEQSLRNQATALDLDADAIFAALQSDPVFEALSQNFDLANRLDIQGTPGFVINGKVIPSYLPPERMIAEVADARKRAQN